MKPNPILITCTFLILLSACTPQILNNTVSVTDEKTENKVASNDEGLSNKASVDSLDGASSNDFSLPEKLEEIGLENAEQIELLASIYPKTLPYLEVSPDGRFYAKGVPGKLTVFEVQTGSQVSLFEVEFPNCTYGSEQYFHFNQDGSFIAVITRTSIQVLQTGGGLIFENPLSRTFDHRFPSCGFDLPQVALSPDGKLLAVSGIDYSGAEPTRFFRVVDILANKVLYEWNRKNDTLHGDLSGFFGLGFSNDGLFIQTFDPRRFILTRGNLNEAFRFWSVNTWEEVTNSNVLRASFNNGELLFPLSYSDQVTFNDKLTGEILAEISAKGCNWDFPCEAAFSDDGTKALLLSREKHQTQFSGQLFFRKIEVLDLDKEEMIHSAPGLYRNLESLRVTDVGELIISQSMDSYLDDEQIWQVSSDLFQGLQKNREGEINFTPNRIGSEITSECPFCSTCNLRPDLNEMSCRTGIEGSHGWYSIRLIDNDYWLVKHNPDGDGPVGKLSLQPSGDPEKLRLRLLNYSEESRTAFYCLDMDFRPQKCVIDDLASSRLVEEFKDISFLRVSPDGNFVTFIDASPNTLFIFDLKKQKISRRSHYQAKASITNPVFSDDGRTLYYLVETLNRKGDYSVEILDMLEQKVIKRFSPDADINLPVALAINRNENLIAVANRNGDFVLVSLDNPKISFEFETSQNQLVGIAFGLNDQVLVILDQMGRFYLWGIID